MKDHTRGFSLVLLAPATGDTVGSCPVEKIAWEPEIRAVQRAWACRGEGACAGRAGTRRGAAYLLSRMSCALSRPKRSDVGMLSLSYRPAVVPKARADGLPRRTVHLKVRAQRRGQHGEFDELAVTEPAGRWKSAVHLLLGE